MESRLREVWETCLIELGLCELPLSWPPALEKTHDDRS